MSTRTEPRPRPTAAGEPAVATADLPPTRASHPAALALTSGLLLDFAFPPADRGYLAWFALVPLFLLVGSDRPRRSIYLGAWLGGLVFALLAVAWLWEVDKDAWPGWLAMAVYLSAYWPAFLLLTRTAVRTLKLPLMLAGPILWVALEYVRAHALTGFPWYFLAQTQSRALPLIQVADLTGVYGVSFLVALVNAWLVDLLRLPLASARGAGFRLARPQVVRLVALVAVLSADLGYGAFRLATARFRPGPRVALLQSNLTHADKLKFEGPQILGFYGALIQDALRRSERPDLIVWPETSYPYSFVQIDAALRPDDFERQVRALDRKATVEGWRRLHEITTAELHGWADELDVPMLVGTGLYEFRPAGLGRSNAAILFEPRRRETRIYRKIHLVPFGEYVPLVQTFPWIARLTPFSPESLPRLDSGAGPVQFALNGWTFAAVICFEDSVPHLTRRSFLGPGQPDVLVNLSNDGWFGDSAEHEMHLAVSVFRAVENRVPLVRAVNSGISAVVDGNGRVLQALPRLTEGSIVAAVPLDDRRSFYSAAGDWFPLTCLAITLGLVVQAGWRGRRPGRAGTTRFAQGAPIG